MAIKNKTNLPEFSHSIKHKYMKVIYHYLISNALYIFLTPLLFIALTHLSIHDLIIQLNENLIFQASTPSITTTAVIVSTIYIMNRPRKIYLVDFACYKPDHANMLSKERYMDTVSRMGFFTEESLSFMRKILDKSGIGDMAYGPEGLMELPLKTTMSDARKETEDVIVGVVEELLKKTGVDAREIGILVVNSSLLNPTPSLSAMVVNRFKLRGNILSYNLGGMGCSAGLISIDLAKQLLQGNPNTYALVISTENITFNWYRGNDRSMLLTNCLFRVGGAAILLSNRSYDRRCSKYQLLHTIRTHKGADDKSYNCVMQKEDDTNKIGVLLSKDLMSVAGDALKTNITTLGPLVLPMPEQLLFLASIVAKKVFKMKKIKPYIPDFKLAFEHFCIHAGGKAVLDELEKSLELSEWHMEPARMTLYRFGNVSSSSLWYELAYMEAKGRIQKGDRTWQIAFGSGFKCNSAVWRALRNVDPTQEKNPWMDEIHNFPPAHIHF